MDLPRTLSLLKKSARGVFSFQGAEIVYPSLRGQNLAQMEILQGRAIPYMLHGDEGCAILIVSFQGVDGKRMLTCPWMTCWIPRKNWVSEGRVVEFGLRSIKFFRLLWETLPWSVAQQVVRGWNMLESLNNRTYILCFNYLNMHQVLWCIVYMCLCNFLVGM